VMFHSRPEQVLSQYILIYFYDVTHPATRSHPEFLEDIPSVRSRNLLSEDSPISRASFSP